jgi:hypothetical protein
MRITVLPALFLAFIPATIQAQCTPQAPVQTALDGLPIQTPDETDWTFRQKYDAAIQALRARFPGNLFVEHTYIRTMWRHADKDRDCRV